MFAFTLLPNVSTPRVSSIRRFEPVDEAIANGFIPPCERRASVAFDVEVPMPSVLSTYAFVAVNPVVLAYDDEAKLKYELPETVRAVLDARPSIELPVRVRFVPERAVVDGFELATEVGVTLYRLVTGSWM